jgi:hypothetical protein
LSRYIAVVVAVAVCSLFLLSGCPGKTADKSPEVQQKVQQKAMGEMSKMKGMDAGAPAKGAGGAASGGGK